MESDRSVTRFLIGAKLLAERVKNLMKDRPEFEWSDALKNVFPEEFREKSEAALSGGLVDWFQAFGCELVSKDRRLQPTPFDMTVAAVFS